MASSADGRHVMAQQPRYCVAKTHLAETAASSTFLPCGDLVLLTTMQSVLDSTGGWVFCCSCGGVYSRCQASLFLLSERKTENRRVWSCCVLATRTDTHKACPGPATHSGPCVTRVRSVLEELRLLACADGTEQALSSPAALAVYYCAAVLYYRTVTPMKNHHTAVFAYSRSRGRLP